MPEHECVGGPLDGRRVTDDTPTAEHGAYAPSDRIIPGPDGVERPALVWVPDRS